MESYLSIEHLSHIGAVVFYTVNVEMQRVFKAIAGNR